MPIKKDLFTTPVEYLVHRKLEVSISALPEQKFVNRTMPIPQQNKLVALVAALGENGSLLGNFSP